MCELGPVIWERTIQLGETFCREKPVPVRFLSFRAIKGLLFRHLFRYSWPTPAHPSRIRVQNLAVFFSNFSTRHFSSAHSDRTPRPKSRSPTKRTRPSKIPKGTALGPAKTPGFCPSRTRAVAESRSAVGRLRPETTAKEPADRGDVAASRLRAGGSGSRRWCSGCGPLRIRPLRI